MSPLAAPARSAMSPRSGRRGIGVLALVLAAACGGGEGDGSGGGSDPGTTAGGPASGAAAPAAGAGATATDSLVVVANLEEARLHLLPRDWQDLFHFRYAERVLVLDPNASPATAAFMEGVLRAEARRTGVTDAGFDWLRRLDRAVTSYEADTDDAAFRLRRGDAAFALLPASEVASLLDRPGLRLVPMSSGAHPDLWYGTDSGGPPEPEPALPPDWLATWAAEVRGKG